MNKNSRFPPLNPLRFIPANDSLSYKYNTWANDRGFFYQQRRPHQMEADYIQQWQNLDRIIIYFDSLASSVNITIIDGNNKLIHTLGTGVLPIVSLPGNTDTKYGDVYNTFGIAFIPNVIGITQGYYYIVVENLYDAPDSTENTFFVAEKIQITPYNLAKTLLFEYANETNDYDVLFEAVDFPDGLFTFRVEASLEEVLPGGHDVAFENMFFQVEKVQSVPYRVFTLIVGGNAGVPAWVIDKVNRILACDLIYIDGVQYVKENNAAFQPKKVENYRMISASINLREAKHDAGWEYPDGGYYTPPTGFRVHDDTHDDTHS